MRKIRDSDFKTQRKRISSGQVVCNNSLLKKLPVGKLEGQSNVWTSHECKKIFKGF